MAQLAWRIADTGWCGASVVRVAALDGGRALVVGGGLFGPWSIWMNAAQLTRVESAPQALHPMKHPCAASEPTADLPRLVQSLQDRNNAV